MWGMSPSGGLTRVQALAYPPHSWAGAAPSPGSETFKKVKAGSLGSGSRLCESLVLKCRLLKSSASLWCKKVIL